jgi:hypothetical protein
MRRTRIPLLIALAVLVAGAALAQTAAGHALLRGAGLERVSAPHAALSFAQPQSLPTELPTRLPAGQPSQVPASRTTVHVPFTIRNDSDTTQSYRWSLDAAGTGRSAGGRAVRPATGRITVAPGATVTMDPALSLRCAGGQLRITVRLASPAESIYFLAGCPAPAK